MRTPIPNLLPGACSWNYASWVGLVYSRPQKKSVDYLNEYSIKYSTVEIDSWFYKILKLPDPIRMACLNEYRDIARRGMGE